MTDDLDAASLEVCGAVNVNRLGIWFMRILHAGPFIVRSAIAAQGQQRRYWSGDQLMMSLLD